MIRIENLSYAYEAEKDKVFEDFSLHIDKGEFLAITGVSGSGKTTLMRLLLRDLSPDNGRIVVDGENIAQISASKLYNYRRKIGSVFQDVKLLENKNVYDNLSFCARALEIPRKNEFDRISAILKLLGMIEYHKKMPGQLSGGQRAKLGIGRALLSKPKILLCDEPTGNLDPAASEEIIKLLKIIQAQGTTIVMVSHDIRLIEQFNIKIITLKQESEEI